MKNQSIKQHGYQPHGLAYTLPINKNVSSDVERLATFISIEQESQMPLQRIHH